MSSEELPSGSTYMKCQACGAQGLERLLDLGHQPLCNEFWPPQDSDQPQTFYPLCLFHCSNCSLVQLGYTIPTVQTFGEQYTYLTGTSQSLVDYYFELAVKAWNAPSIYLAMSMVKQSGCTFQRSSQMMDEEIDTLAMTE